MLGIGKGSEGVTCAIFVSSYSSFVSPNRSVDLGHQAIGGVIRIDERKSTEFILIDRSYNFVVDGRQDWILLGEFTIEVEGVSPVFLS